MTFTGTGNIVNQSTKTQYQPENVDVLMEDGSITVYYCGKPYEFYDPDSLK